MRGLLVLFRHPQLFAGHEFEARLEEMHRFEQRMNRAAIFQVADHRNRQVFERSLRLVDGVEVEHRLRRVLIRAVAGVDDGHLRNFTRIARSTFERMAHHDEVGVVADHLR